LEIFVDVAEAESATYADIIEEFYN